jgi:TPR repeat protein
MQLRALIAAGLISCLAAPALTFAVHAQTAGSELQAAAEAGDADAAYEHGYALTFPAEGTPDYDAGRQWLLQSANDGQSGAHHILGVIYRDGIGVTSDMGQARSHFEAAWTLGDPVAALALAELLVFELPGETVNGVSLLDDLQSDEIVGADARFMLAELLFFGVVGSRDETRGVLLAEQALEIRPDLFDAYYLVGIGAMEGVGRDADPERARALWSQGARGGDTLSMLALADALRDGRGGAVDAIEALALYGAADAMGHPDAYEAYLELDAVLNEDERSSARRRMTEFLDGLS